LSVDVSVSELMTLAICVKKSLEEVEFTCVLELPYGEYWTLCP
jgi:hypothetical protein